MNAGKFRAFVKCIFLAGSLVALASLPVKAELLVGLSFPSQGGDNDVIVFDSSNPGTILFDHPSVAAGIHFCKSASTAAARSPEAKTSASTKDLNSDCSNVESSLPESRANLQRLQFLKAELLFFGEKSVGPMILNYNQRPAFIG
jgi:hypothetical protein